MATNDTVTVTTSPTLLSTGRTGTVVAGRAVTGHRIGVTCDVDLYMGKASGTLSTTVYAVKLPAGAQYERFLEEGEAWYGLVATGTGTAHVDAEGVGA